MLLSHTTIQLNYSFYTAFFFFFLLSSEYQWLTNAPKYCGNLVSENNTIIISHLHFYSAFHLKISEHFANNEFESCSCYRGKNDLSFPASWLPTKLTLKAVGISFPWDFYAWRVLQYAFQATQGSFSTTPSQTAPQFSTFRSSKKGKEQLGTLKAIT